MNRILTFVFATILMAFPFQQVKAAPKQDSVIVIIPGNYPETPIPNRNIPPISAMFHTETSSVVVSFSTQLGEVAISIMNLPTGEVFNETVNSIFSTVMIPIAGSAGIYIISFLLSNEERYYGQFEIPPVGSIKNESSSKMAGKMR